MLVAPAATPKPVVDRLHRELLAISREPDIRDEFVRQGLIPVETPSPKELKEYVRSQIAYWRQMLPKIGLAGIE